MHAIILACMSLLAVIAAAPSASAHGADETQEGYLLVQQALGHLAHDTSPEGIDLAMEKVNDALAAEDQEGVVVADIEQAKSALEAGQVDQARELLQGSITQALSMLGPATGEQTGTTVVTSELLGRQGLTGRDAGFLVVSVLLLLAGVGLAFLFRPRDNIGDLRRQLGGPNNVTRGGGRATTVGGDR